MSDERITVTVHCVHPEYPTYTRCGRRVNETNVVGRVPEPDDEECSLCRWMEARNTSKEL